LILGLERSGVDARFEGRRGRDAVGRHRLPGKGQIRQALLVANDMSLDVAASRADLRMIAYAGTVPAPERARPVQGREALTEQWRAGDASDAEYFRGTVALNRRIGSAVAVFASRAS
jgi:hypothetical protein